MVANIEKTDTNYAMGRYYISFEKTWDRSQIKLKKNRSERKSFKSTIQHENYLGPACNNRYFQFFFFSKNTNNIFRLNVKLFNFP